MSVYCDWECISRRSSITVAYGTVPCDGSCKRHNRGMAQTSKEKQEAFRARQAMLGNTEVRGIYAPLGLHAAIKEAARKLVEQQKPEEKK